ncbi:MAG: putative rane protein [Actinomycetota bacterium]|jgi:putative membrane protein|nr:putative rane protein [Actinomycetota bacterium]
MTTGDDWQRLHPLTPVLRGWRILLVAVAAFGQQGLRQQEGFNALYLGLGVLAATLFGTALSFLSWRRTRYRLTATELQIDSGILQRRSRRVPLARLQAVDVVRPVVARVLGLAELRLEVVGGAGKAEAPLAYLSEEHAHALRGRLLAAAAGRDGDAAAEVHEGVLVRVPTGTLVASVLLGTPILATAVLVLVLGVVTVMQSGAALPVALAALPTYAGVITLSGRRVLQEYGFTVAEAPDGLRLRHGLLDTRSQTIPAGRVQAIRVLEPLLWRPFGWARVEVDVAGYGGGRSEEQAATSALLPVAPRALAHALVGRVLGRALPVAAAPVPSRARWRAPLSRRRLQVGLDHNHLVTTHGVLTTTTDVVPLTKIQSLRLTSGPWQHWLRLATLHADTAGRRLSGAVGAHRDVYEARALLDEVARRSRAHRAKETTEQIGQP